MRNIVGGLGPVREHIRTSHIYEIAECSISTDHPPERENLKQATYQNEEFLLGAPAGFYSAKYMQLKKSHYGTTYPNLEVLPPVS